MEKLIDNIADEALKEGKPVSVTVEESAPQDYDPRKYPVGMYRSDKYFRIIKELTYEHTKDANGNIQRTTGTWCKPSNMIIFQKGVETRLTAEDMKLPSVRALIDRKMIYRIG